MIPRHPLVFAFSLAILALSQFTPSTKSQTTTTSPNALRTITLQASGGKVLLHLPDEIAAGDTISGTVVVEPARKAGTEESKGANDFSGLVVEVNKQRWAVSEGVISGLTIPTTVTRALQISLLDAKGKKLDTKSLLVTPKAKGSSVPGFETPAVGQSGFPLLIKGPFDGDSSNTKINVGVTRLRVIAESPRGAVVEVPTNVIGPNHIAVSDNGQTATNSFRTLKIDLTAPKTSLRRGESTQLQVQVQGLQGLTQPVPIQIQNQTPQNVSIAGGNAQTVLIPPSQVPAGGSFNWTTTITGTGTGNFNITGTVTPTAPGSTRSAESPSSTTTQTSAGNSVGIVMTAAEYKERCDELQRQLNEAKRPCEEKRRECAELEKKLASARAAAERAQADADKAKSEFDAAMQNALNNLIAAARAKGFDTKLSLKAENKNYRPLQLAPGVVIYFDTGIVDLQNAETYLNNLANALRQLVSSATINQLKKAATAHAEAERKNREAQAALLLAQNALDKCLAERDALCPRVKELEAELDRCRKAAAAEADAERQAKERADAERKAAAEAERQKKAATAG